MNKQIDLFTDKSFISTHYPESSQNTNSNFQQILNTSLARSSAANDTAALTPEFHTSSQKPNNTTDLVPIGTTSKVQPTVSHILSSNNDFKDKHWDIIFSDINKEKAYTTVPLGATIYYDKKSGELSWSKNAKIEESITINNTGKTNQTASAPEAQEISLGKVGTNSPTVSHLLAASSELSSEKWNILAASANKNKDFSKIPNNAEIWFNKVTKELSWQGSSSIPVMNSSPENELRQSVNLSLTQSTATKAGIGLEYISQIPNMSNPPNFSLDNSAKLLNQHPAQEKSSLPPDLTEAVKPLIGTPYDEIDCYGLVINGLKKMGLPYSGQGGLRNKLTSMARQKGLPSNAYLTGEGIVKATGTQVFSHSSTKISNWTKEADKTYQDMKQLLQKGQILSFSTPTRGHTGIISQHNDKWTFINSGRMDNHVAAANRSKEVGEENLVNEVHNWFKLAKKNREPLLVTLGQIEKDKIRTTIQPNFQLSQRI